MKGPLACLGLLMAIWSCSPSADRGGAKQESDRAYQSSAIDSKEASSPFNYDKFEISRGRLGEIEIGMTISEAEEKFVGLQKETGQATNFGYGGGSPAYLYIDQDNMAFGLIPSLNTDTILFIIAASDKFRTTNGLNPHSRVRDISKIYPRIKVNQDLMNGWEYISDETNNWDFVFRTKEETVGVYPELEVPSDLVNLDIIADWIRLK